ncbi:HEXXH motif domain-containing protein [Plantactinospora sp. KLBMP9567]|uniref:HEXXH motif domain-containing protein n=1 Tax=Plantactinospora sp. KLBMP9567 TaxID=3085900 RepID=UPI00298101DB|nr:HEXXH motif domain-containing protein [Plantactinospora sp. KLBMP9567]MDW5326483.1 HEXXH motif domain-containing protein [Plantactinospora sp. KLBMP9567]
MVDRVDPQPNLPHHRLPREHLDALCTGDGGPDLVRALWHTQRSRRLLLLHAVVEAARAEPRLLGPLPPADAAREVLIRAERAAPAEFTELLLHPQIGNWAAYALRRHRGGTQARAPIWVDFGALHAVALVAAARAGLSWRTRLPARSGRVMLPSLGMAVLADSTGWQQVPAECADGVLRIGAPGDGPTVRLGSPEEEVPGWWSLRRLTVGPDPRLRVLLDDVDPYRELADPVEPDRLDAAAVARWTELLAGAWQLLHDQWPDGAEAIAAAVVSLVPLPSSDDSETRSASTGEAFGSVMVSTPPDEVTLAVALVHEFQHIKLGGMMHLVPLTAGPDEQVRYAPWRDDPRPVSGLVQGIYAFVGIAGFWRDYRLSRTGPQRRSADLEYAYARAQVREALRDVRQPGSGLTGWGERLVAGLTERVEPWLADPLPTGVVRAAELIAAGHRAGWRIRHLHPPPTDVRRLTRAWARDQRVEFDSYRPGLMAHPQRRWSPGMLLLVRRHIAGHPLPPGPRMRSLDLTEADVALVRDDLDAARAGYRARLGANPHDLNAWVGLGLSTFDPDPHSGSALLHRPELVRAVYVRAVEEGYRPDPVRLTAWLDEATAALTA